MIGKDVVYFVLFLKTSVDLNRALNSQLHYLERCTFKLSYSMTLEKNTYQLLQSNAHDLQKKFQLPAVLYNFSSSLEVMCIQEACSHIWKPLQ